ncbi:MAG: DUF434 domain-containing protein [Taibaiella sp.]|nr:DUF434 domain-containing protein [Taibaiella sp.]
MNNRNRGKNSGDDQLFGSEKTVKILQEAIRDMHYLLSRGFAENASAALVGNRYRLRARQIQMIKAASAGEQELNARKIKKVEAKALAGKTIYIDGFNLLILLESLLSGAYIFKGCDGCYRDLSSVHGSYKRVQQTNHSIELVALFHQQVAVSKIVWIFDKPVSNSGRLKQLLLEYAQERQLNWEVYLEFNPDRYLAAVPETIISSDAWILDHCTSWFNLPDYLVHGERLAINLVDTFKA